MPDLISPLSEDEQATLLSCEETIDAGLTTFVAVGEALAVIRDRRLYRATHATFEEYCRAQWEISRPRAYELMNAAGAVSGMPDTDRPTNARQATALARVPESDRPQVWAEANERTGGQPTATVIEQIRTERTATTAGGPQPGEQVWVAAARRAIEAHRIKTASSTGCGRSTRTGLTMTAGQAAEKHEAVWCRRCWPDSAPDVDGPCGRCGDVVPADELADPAEPGRCALCRLQPPDDYVEITGVPYGALLPGDYVQVPLGRTGAVTGWERVVRAVRGPDKRTPLVEVTTDLVDLLIDPAAPRWDVPADGTTTVSRASGRTVAARGVAVCEACRSQVPTAVTRSGRCPACVGPREHMQMLRENLAAQDPTLRLGPEQSMTAALVREGDQVWVEPAGWQSVASIEITAEPDAPGAWVVRSRTRRSAEHRPTSAWGWMWDEALRVRRPAPAVAAPAPTVVEDLGDPLQQRLATDPEFAAAYAEAEQEAGAGDTEVLALVEPVPQPLTEQQIGRLRLAFAHARANGWRHVDWDGTPMRTRLECDFPEARIEVAWDVDESELRIGYSLDQYRTRDDVLLMSDVGQALDILCVLGYLPLDQSAQYCQGLLDGVNACAAGHDGTES